MAAHLQKFQHIQVSTYNCTHLTSQSCKHHVLHRISECRHHTDVVLAPVLDSQLLVWVTAWDLVLEREKASPLVKASEMVRVKVLAPASSLLALEG